MLIDVLDRLIVSSPECQGNFGPYVVLCDASQVMSLNASHQPVLAMLAMSAMAPILTAEKSFDVYIKEGKKMASTSSKLQLQSCDVFF